ncbi:MAG: peptidoglycan-associated lipoprotein Pal [Thermodesulfovibrionales bacterium]
MKRHFFILIISIFLVWELVGCAPKTTPPPPSQPETPQTDTKTPTERPSTPDRDKTPRETITEREMQTAKRDDIKSIVKELQSKIKDIYFDFDRYDIRDDAKPILRQVADALISNKKIKVVIEGHCDERGTREYNLGLGEKRANAAKQYLISLGLPSSRVETVSYGKEKPQCQDKTEECWAKNRRAHFVFIEEIQ